MYQGTYLGAVNQDLFAYVPYIILILRYGYLHYTGMYLSLDAIIAIYCRICINLLGTNGVYVFHWNDAIVPKVLISVNIAGRL